MSSPQPEDPFSLALSELESLAEVGGELAATQVNDPGIGALIHEKMLDLKPHMSTPYSMTLICLK
ncbi:hypothetical protein MMC28_006096 [Mycoblastus sanguinarius]|nr:hypothetical protein [Mycoblastus sanguinarius]